MKIEIKNISINLDREEALILYVCLQEAIDFSNDSSKWGIADRINREIKDIFDINEEEIQKNKSKKG